MNSDISEKLQQQIQSAYENSRQLKIVGGNSKTFYGNKVEGEALNVSEHKGVLNYEPTELVLTARSGTRLSEIENLLEQNGQMLGFEPPGFGETATLGGTIACNFSGPRRPYTGAARDFVLGCKIINGKGELLTFGGEVMKNVAGYDVSRLMTGALGTLGVLLEVSLKVLPKPEKEATRVFEVNEQDALQMMQNWGLQPMPISATCYYGNRLFVRISGAEKGVTAAIKTLGGDEFLGAEQFWHDIKEHQFDFFQSNQPLWRLSLASDSPPLDLPGETLYEWGGAQRWLTSDVDAQSLFAYAKEFDGHATLYRNRQPETDVFQVLSSGLLQIHKNLKSAFDTKGILNPGKMYKSI